MKSALILLLSVSFLSHTLTAQNKLPGVEENKYRINLPDYWGKGNKVWDKLIDKLPVVCEELKDKEICGDDCNPEYTIEFYITEPVIFGYYSKKNFSPPYTNTRHLVSDWKNVNQSPTAVQNPEAVYYATNNHSWQLTTEYGFQCFLLLTDTGRNIITKLILVDTNEVWQVMNNIILASASDLPFREQNPDSYIENNKKKLNPNIYHLLAIVDKKLLSL
jgi:hypothetical protein